MSVRFDHSFQNCQIQHGFVESIDTAYVLIEQWKKGPWLVRFCFGDEILPCYVGIIMNHNKDPYETTSTLW